MKQISNRRTLFELIFSRGFILVRRNQDELRALCKKNENIKRAVDTVLSSHMARKLSDTLEEQVAPVN